MPNELVDPFELVEPQNREQVKEYFDRAYLQMDRDVEEEWKKIGPTTPPDTIYHYTTPGGLLGIVEHHSIFLTDAFFLNDQSELLYGRSLALEILQRRLAAATADVYEFIRLGIEKFDPFEEQYVGFRYYVACFCPDGNLLSQWRAYGAPGYGFSLGFASAPLHEKQYAGEVPHVVLHRIEYEPANQRHMVDFVD